MAKRMREYAELGSDLRERAEHVACHALAITDEVCREAVDRELSLKLLITFMSESKTLTSFSYRFFRVGRPPGLGLTFEATKRNEKFGRIQC